MKTLNQTMNIFSLAFLFITTVAMIMVGIVGEVGKVLFFKIKDYKIPKHSYKYFQREYKSYTNSACC